MTVIIWTSSDQANFLRRVCEPAFSLAQTPHRVEPLNKAEDIPKIKKGDVLIAMGPECLAVMRQYGAVPKNRTIGSLRQKMHDYPPGKLLISYDPGIIEVDTGREPEIVYDLQLACRLHDTGTMIPKVGKYKYVENFDKVIKQIKKAYKKGKPVFVAGDLETIGFDPHYKSEIPWKLAEGEEEPEGYYPDARIISISFTVKPGTAYVYKVPEEVIDPYVRDQVDFICNTKKVKITGANWKFDCLWMLEHWDIVCTNQKFDTGIVGCLKDENRSNSLNLHAKIYTPIGGYDDCVAPGTKVCTADLKWIPVENVKPGDKLVGFDEEIPGPRQRRRLRVTTAESTKIIQKSVCRVFFSNGVTIKCSRDHGFLAHKYQSNGPFQWIHAKDLKQGCRVQVAIPIEVFDESWGGGYLSGMYDGEGYVSHAGAGIVSGVSQKPGPVWNRYVRFMDYFGFGGFYAHQKNTDGVMTSKHSGWPTLQLLQKFRPIRLINKFCFDGHTIPSGAPKVTVAYVELLDESEDVVSLQTSTHTFVAEGICSHNSFNQNHDKSRMDLVLRKDPEGFLTYAGGDTDACLRVTHALRPELLEDKQLTNFYINLLQPTSAVFTKLEHRGVYVDEKQYDKLQVQCEAEMVEAHNTGLKMIPRKMRIMFDAEPIKSTKDKLSLTRPTLIKEFLFTKKGLNLKPTMFTAKAKEKTWEYASTAADHLETFAQNEDAAEFIECYSGFNGAKKTLSTYILGFRKHLRSDGMFHPSYNLYKGDFGGKGDDSGTVTGRLSTRDPAYQTIPKHTKWAKPLRTVYIAPPGMAILKLDYSQGELRVAACVAHEETMIAAYKSGLDMHLKTGAEVYGISLKKALKWKRKEDERIGAVRQGGKAGNFGLLYAMSPPGFVNYAWTTYGVALTLQEATHFYNSFFEMYPGLILWHEKFKELARQYLMVRNPLGRIRHLPLINSRSYKHRAQAERQSINSPIQSCLSDMMLLAMVLIDREYPDLHMFGMTHDEMQCYVPVDEVELWAKRLGDIMSNLPLADFGWKPELTFPVDAEWSTTNLAECVGL